MRRDREPYLCIGLRGRYTLYAAMLTTLVVLALTALSYFHARTLMRDAAERQMQQVAASIAERIGKDITMIGREVASLAAQPLLVNALLDSQGREAYLQPFLVRHELPVPMDYNLALVDYRGEPLVARKAPASFVGAPWIEAAIERGEAHVGIERREGDSVLRIAVPVRYPFTGTHEGVLVFEASLTAWLGGAHSPFGKFDAGLAHVELLQGGTVIVQHTRDPARELVSVSAPVEAELPQPLALSLRIAMDHAAFGRPLAVLLGEHLWWGLLAVLLVAVASAALARVQTRRIKDLADEARNMAHAGWPRDALTVGRFGNDEIGDLATSLAKLLGDLKAHQGELEALVARRTAELAAREADLHRAQSVAHIGSWVHHPESGMLELSAEAARICGVPGVRMLPFADLMRLVHADDRDAVSRAWRAAFVGAPYDIEHRLVAGGETRWVHAQAESLLASDGRFVRSVGTVQDVTERRRTEARMREASVVFEASSQGIMTTDGEGVISSVNPAFCRITGYAPEEAIGRKSSILRSGRHDEAFYEAMWSALKARGAWEGEIWNRRRNGELYPQWLTISAVRGEHGRIVEYVAIFSDITERKRHEEAIWRQANFDALTGLANRSLLHDRLGHALAQARRSGRKVGLLFLDLDGFKWINDTLGHHVGDELLIEVAQRLKRCVRDQDTVARLGGDEFTIAVGELHDAEDLRGIGDKVLSVLAEPFALAGTRHRISGSVGITVFPDDGEDVPTLLRHADIAMYKSKQEGKNRYHFYAPEMQSDASRPCPV